MDLGSWASYEKTHATEDSGGAYPVSEYKLHTGVCFWDSLDIPDNSVFNVYLQVCHVVLVTGLAVGSSRNCQSMVTSRMME